ncbi:MAG: o-succinylbenzoate synthase [Candidatus Methanodesulfokora sp.]
MQIRSLEMFHVKMDLVAPFETSFGIEKERECIIIRAEERGGEEGWGEVPASSGPWYSHETAKCEWHIIEDFISKDVIGKEIEKPQDIWKGVVSRIRGHNMAKAGVDMALWDLYSRIEGKSLSKAIGGEKDRIESGVSIGIKRNLESLIETVKSNVEKGYRRIKLKIKPGWDLEVVREVRKELPDFPMHVDANGAYDMSYLRLFRELDRYNLMMIEQPFSFEDLVQHSELARLIRTPICLDESITSKERAVEAYRIGSCSIINVKPARIGGLTKTLELHDFCVSAGIPIWIGGLLETGIGRAHLVAAASLPGVKYPNDISASSRYYREDIVIPEWSVEDGFIRVPKGRGIGVEVAEEKLLRFAQRRLLIK